MKPEEIRMFPAAVLLLLAAGCSAGGGQADGAQDAGELMDRSEPSDAADAAIDAALDSSHPSDTSYPSDAAYDAGFDAGLDAGGSCVPVTEKPPKLTPDRIAFAEVNAPARGSFLYLTVWGDLGTDSVQALSPDGKDRKVLFTANRIWAAGATQDGKAFAFSSADPDQEKDYYLTVGDAIQYTWIYKPGSAPYQLTNGNINDECHSFVDGGKKLLMCRRADFYQCMQGSDFVIGNDSYRILTVDIASGDEQFLTPSVETIQDIGPQLRPDGTILFWRQEYKSGKFVQSMMSMNGDGTGIKSVGEGWTAPKLSPDGTKVLFRANKWMQIMLSPSGDFSSPVLVKDGAGKRLTKFDFSPDSKKLAYSIEHASANCDDIHVADLPDGANDALILDCVKEGLNVVGLRWVEVKP
jgi:Tol biopolymer transport system component